MDRSVHFPEIKGKIITGVYALTTRTFVLQVISFISTFILTILLDPSVFGVFFIVSAVISFLSYFSDVGLAAALIQKKQEPTREELVSVFTLQQILVGSIVTIAFLFSLQFAQFYGLKQDGVFLLRALLISFFLSSLKTIPSIILERRLDFSRLIIPQVLETFVFYTVAIILAFLGQGIISFAYAAILRGIVGLLAIYIISPWRISLGISIASVKELLSFGVPFQANSFLALVKDDLMTIFLGKILPFAHVGYLGWAKKWAEVPLRLIMDSIIRVTFPAYSRLQEEKQILAKALNRSMFFLALFIFPITALLILYIRPLIFLIPKYIKWEGALVPFYFFAVSSIFASFSSPLINALNAIGKIKKTLLLMVFWTIATWVLVPLFTILFGYQGSASAFFLVSISGIIPIILMRRYVYFKIAPAIVIPAIATVAMFLTIFIFLALGRGVEILLSSAVVGVFLYILIIWYLAKDEIVPYLPKRAKLWFPQ